LAAKEIYDTKKPEGTFSGFILLQFLSRLIQLEDPVVSSGFIFQWWKS